MKITEVLKKSIREDNNTATESGADDLAFAFGLQITELRMVFGLTQTAFAKKIGTYQSAIARMERGLTIPSMKTLEKIAQAFDIKLIPPQFIFTKEKTMVANQKIRTRHKIKKVLEISHQ